MPDRSVPIRYRPSPASTRPRWWPRTPQLGDGVSIGAHCVDRVAARGSAPRVVLMPRCYVGPQAVDRRGHAVSIRGVVLREECVIGARCILHPGVVIGSDGFGFAFDSGRYHKVPQVGNVVIGDDVEIGANTTIDRATTDSTRDRRRHQDRQPGADRPQRRDRQALHHRRAGRDLGQHRARGLRDARRPGRSGRPHQDRRRARMVGAQSGRHASRCPPTAS